MRSAERAATSCCQSGYRLSGLSARSPLRASGVVSMATVPGRPASGTSRGSRPSRPPTASSRPRPVRRRNARRVVWRIAPGAAAGPSTSGVCAIAAARPGLRAATGKMWPPESEKPQIATLVGSTSGRVRANCDRGVPVGVLFADADDLPWLTAALPETAVVEGEHREPGLVEQRGEPIGPRLLGHRSPAGHDHARTRGPRVVPGSARRVAARELNLLAVGRASCADGARSWGLAVSTSVGGMRVSSLRSGGSAYTVAQENQFRSRSR